jgi:hypothetical protein
MVEPRADPPTAITLGADQAYDAEDFVDELRSMKVTAHVARNTSGRRSAIDGRTTRHGDYAVSQRIEEAFGWIKTIAGQEKSRFRGRDRMGLLASLPPPTIWCGSQADSGGLLMVKELGFAKAFAGRRRIVEMDIRLRLRTLLRSSTAR